MYFFFFLVSFSGDRQPRRGKRSVSRPIASSCSCSSPPSRSPSANQRCQIHCAPITPPCMPCRTSNPGLRTGSRPDTTLLSISILQHPGEDGLIRWGSLEDNLTGLKIHEMENKMMEQGKKKTETEECLTVDWVDVKMDQRRWWVMQKSFWNGTCKTALGNTKIYKKTKKESEKKAESVIRISCHPPTALLFFISEQDTGRNLPFRSEKGK